jgi:hypothetical protein
VERAASSQDLTLAEPDAAARTQVADTLAQLATGKGDPAAISRAEVLGKIIRQGDRLLRQMQLNSPLYLLMAVAKGQATAPGRKTALYFAGGLDVPSQIDNVFKATQSEANRAHVSFYAIDVGGLDTWSEAQSSRSALEDVARTSREQAQKTSGGTSRDEIKVDENAEASTRANWKQPLRLSEGDGRFASSTQTTGSRWGVSPPISTATTRSRTRPRSRPGRQLPQHDVRVSGVARGAAQRPSATHPTTPARSRHELPLL